MPNSPPGPSKPPSQSANDGNLATSIYNSYSNDPSKLHKLMSNVSTHAFAEQIPNFHGHWVLSDYSNIFRVDNNNNNYNNNTQNADTSSIRSKLKGTYPRTSPPRNSSQIQKKEEEKIQGKSMDIDQAVAYITAKVESDVGEKDKSNQTQKKKKQRSKKKKSKKTSLPSSTTTIQSEITEQEEEMNQAIHSPTDLTEVDVVLGSDTEISEGGKSAENQASPSLEPISTLPLELSKNHEVPQIIHQGVLSSIRIPQPHQEQSIEANTNNADETIRSLSQSPIKVKLPPTSDNKTSQPRPPSPSPQQQIIRNISYFGDIPNSYNDPISEELTQLASNYNSSTTNSVTTSATESIDPPVDLPATSANFSESGPPLVVEPTTTRPSSSTITMSNLTPPPSPPATFIESAGQTQSKPPTVSTTEPDAGLGRPLTPPPDLDDEEEDGKLVFPAEPSMMASIPSDLKEIHAPSIPSIILDPRTRPSMFTPSIHPLTDPWTLFFSNTSHQRKNLRPLSPLNPAFNPLSNHPNAADYSSHLVTLFQAVCLEDLFGSWKALRRAIAKSKNRPIEPQGDTTMQGGPGLGTHFFPDETNFHFFKSGIKPMWEDQMCQKGGKIMIAGEAHAMDNLFFDLILLLISGDLDAEVPPPDNSTSLVCGIVLSKRKLTRIEIWLGGVQPPEEKWVGEVTRYVEGRFKAWKVYGYKSFGKN
ncbi:uncharacterized protein L201_004679 [Kwoniella dendrophila CBS 6074]|uniref:Translation initiation factor 4E n=1 Tax=Kwoniella dendrophila CBS 6074 TaxID=1295534 RepID=A0AAX4JXZ9_9TREE